MNVLKLKRVLVFGVTISIVALFGHRLWLQFSPATIVVGVWQAMEPELRKDLESRYAPVPIPDSYEHHIPYDLATNAKISRAEIGRIRGLAAWSHLRAYPVEMILLHDANHVSVYVKADTVSSLEFTNDGGHWDCKVQQAHILRTK